MPKANNPLTNSKFLNGLLDEHLISLNEQEALRHKNRHSVPYCYPSSVGDCARKVVYKLVGYEELISPQLLRIFECGKAMHDRYQRWLNEIGLLTKKTTEVPFISDEYRVSGRMDGILHIPGTDWWCILELKSANKRDFELMKSSKRPLDKYVAQVMLYMALTEYKESLIVVECKDNQSVAWYPVKYSPKEGEKVLERVRLITSCADSRTLPPREYEPESSTCFWCHFKGMCAKNKI